MSDFKRKQQIRFFLHNKEQIVNTETVTPDLTLNQYIRDVLQLRGTKHMCLEGGCGSCVVVLQSVDPITGKEIFLSVNSCLISIMSCHGWRISTIEGLGGPLTKYHPIQATLAKFNGSQCGFCSSGMIMNMYALFQSGKLTMKEVENSFGGNICRCTGYRAILAAFKSLCTDASSDLIGLTDIEDIELCTKEKCQSTCSTPCTLNKQPVYHSLGDSKWVKVYTLKDLLDSLNTFTDSKCMIVGGNTAKGVFKSYADIADVYIDISAVPELKVKQLQNGNLILGASNTLATTMELFYQIAQENPTFAHLKQMADHIDLVANTPVRNLATLAGNLTIKHDHNDFPSDIFLILETVGAIITIVDVHGSETKMSPHEFMKHDMKLKVIKQISIPSFEKSVVYESFKIMARAQNVHAHVNAGFLFDFGANKSLNSIRMIFGNISPSFVHAINTETFLKGRNRFDNTTLQKAFSVLAGELHPDEIAPDPSPAFRKQLAIALFYKAILKNAPAVTPIYQSGGSILERPLSTSVQDYETNKALYPLTQPISKLEALAQCSGKAEYIEDMPELPHQLYASLVLADATPGSTILKIDPTKALDFPNIVAYYDAKDIPGKNSHTPLSIFEGDEEIFCKGTVLYCDQPIGVVVGKTQKAVEDAAKLVAVSYTPAKQAPALSVRDLLKMKRTDRIEEKITIMPKSRGRDVQHVIKGTYDVYQQYHFHMELQICNVIPTENELKVYASTQWMDHIQAAIAQMLSIPNNKVHVIVRRCGGSFGGKISRNGIVSCAAGLASWKLKQPVKIAMTLPHNMRVLGKRWPFSADYEVGVNNAGQFQYMETTMYSDLGRVSNEEAIHAVIDLFTNSYNNDSFQIYLNTANPDTYTNTWARGPGTTEGLGCIESIMEHLAYELNMDPLELRIANFKDKILNEYVADLKTWAQIDQRKKDITKFNQENRWKKKGIAISPMVYTLEVSGPFNAMVSIYHDDGSVSISHGGIEMGQGINTKAAQVCAYKFGIPVEKVSVLPSTSFVAPNNLCTGGSLTSEAICYSVVVACDKLLERLKEYRTPGQSWETLISKCFHMFVNLSAIGGYSPATPGLKNYFIYGITACEVLLDVLTGQHIISRVDIIEDVGEAMNPEIDMGQVEGAFVMGIGFYTTEKIVYNKQGKVLTDNTWTYYPPGAKDIPIDFRIKFPKNKKNPVGVLNSKALAEPPLCMSISVPLAIRNAVASARQDSDKSKPRWFPIDGATTVETVFVNSLNDYSQYVL